jgi:DNA-binding NtrC family response regulator
MSKGTTTPAAQATGHVIIVEDNVEANNLMRDWLRLRFKVTSFLDAESALRMLPPSGDRVVFLIDYNMPGDNGLVLKKKLMPLFPKAKYILISGVFDDKLTSDAKSAGFDVLLPKPFGMPVVTQKIEDLLGLKQQKTGLIDFVRRKAGPMSNLF